MTAVSKMTGCIDVSIPSTANEIKVTNILNPYFMRAIDVIVDDEKKKSLENRLKKVTESYFRKKRGRRYSPRINDHVVLSMQNSSNTNIELPHWFVRGIVVDVFLVDHGTTSKKSTTADVLLVDHGTVINVPSESLAIYPQNAVDMKPLSFTCGIYNVLPLGSDKKVCKEWPEGTVAFVKQLIQSSKKIYLENLAQDNDKNRIYGDLFLVINERNLCLSKFLIEAHMAVALTDELIQAVKNYEPGKDIVLANTCDEKPNNDVSLDRSTSSENENSFSNSFKSTGKLKKNEVDKILIHSKIPCEPLDHIANSRFDATIHTALKADGISKLKQIQSYMWPAIKQGLNVTTIAPPSSGKTLGYIVPILNAIMANDEMLEKQKKDSVTKPFVLVLCATIKACIDITHAFNIVAKHHKKIKSCNFISGMQDKDMMTKICNKFQVVVSTPSFLLRLLSKPFASDLNFSELSYLVLDHADVILHKYLKEIITLIKDHIVINKEFRDCVQSGFPQTIIAARTWTSEIESFVSKFMEDSYICIGSFTEAAAYNGVQGRMLIRHSDKKKGEVLEALKNYKYQKTLIFCLDSAEACELNEFLLSNNIKTLLVHDDMKFFQIDELKKDLNKYTPGTFPAIICTDAILSEFPISDVEYLIHYSVTNDSKTQFNRRFSVLMDNWTTEADKKCKILILFDETKDSVHFKGVVDILKRFKVELPEDWNVIADGLEIQDNMKNKNYPLCNNIKSFGYCNTDQTCHDRHRVIAKTDVPQIPEISIGDELKLFVTYIHSVTHYAARVIECKKGDKVIPFPHNPLLAAKLKNCYNKAENRISPKEIAPGLICVAKNGESYARVKILKIVDTHPANNKPRTVRTQSLDDGDIRERVNIHELYEILDEFLNYKFPIVNVYLTGVSPFDEECKWGDLANHSAKKWFDKNLRGEREPYVWAKALLHIGDSIWTDSLVFRSKILGYADLVSSSLKQVMIQEGHGIENKKHLPLLTHLCISSGMTEINGTPIEIPKDEQEQE